MDGRPQPQDLSPGSSAAFFSTARCTRYPRRIPGPPLPATIVHGGDAEYLRAAVAQAANYWRDRFPEDCMRLWPDNGWRIADLWDDYDIHLETPAFLEQVLSFLVNENCHVSRKLAHQWYAQSPHRFLVLMDHTRSLYDPKEPLAVVNEVFNQSEREQYPAEFLWHVAHLMRAAMIAVGVAQDQAVASPSSGNAQHISAPAMPVQGPSAPLVASDEVNHGQTVSPKTDKVPETATEGASKTTTESGGTMVPKVKPETWDNREQKTQAENKTENKAERASGAKSEVGPENTSDSFAQIKPVAVLEQDVPLDQSVAPVRVPSEVAAEPKPAPVTDKENQSSSLPTSSKRQSPIPIPSVQFGSQIPPLVQVQMPPGIQPPFMPPPQGMPFSGYEEFRPAHPPMGYPQGAFTMPGPMNMPAPNGMPVNPRGSGDRGPRGQSGQFNQHLQPRGGWAENPRSPMMNANQPSPPYYPENPDMGQPSNVMMQGAQFNPSTGPFPPGGYMVPPNQMPNLPMRPVGGQQPFNPSFAGPHPDYIYGATGVRGNQFNDMTNMPAQQPMNPHHMNGQHMEPRGSGRRFSRGDKQASLYNPYTNGSDPKYANFAKINPQHQGRKSSRGGFSNQHGRDRRQSGGGPPNIIPSNFNGAGEMDHYGPAVTIQTPNLAPSAIRKSLAPVLDLNIVNDHIRGCNEHFIGPQNETVNTLYLADVDPTKSEGLKTWIETSSGAKVVSMTFNPKHGGGNYGFVRFENVDGARKGLELNGQKFSGTPMTVKVSRQYFCESSTNRNSPHYKYYGGNKGGLSTPHGHHYTGCGNYGAPCTVTIINNNYSGAPHREPGYSPQDARSSLQRQRPRTEEDAVGRGSPEARKSQTQKMPDIETHKEMRSATPGLLKDKDKQTGARDSDQHEASRVSTPGPFTGKEKQPVARAPTEHREMGSAPGPSEDKSDKSTIHDSTADPTTSVPKDAAKEVDADTKQVTKGEKSLHKDKDKDTATEKATAEAPTAEKEKVISDGAKDIKHDSKTPKSIGKKDIKKDVTDYKEDVTEGARTLEKDSSHSDAKPSHVSGQKPKTASKATDVSKAAKAKASEPKVQRQGTATITTKDAPTGSGSKATVKAGPTTKDMASSSSANAKTASRKTKGRKKPQPAAQQESAMSKSVVVEAQPASDSHSTNSSDDRDNVKPTNASEIFTPTRTIAPEPAVASTPSPSRVEANKSGGEGIKAAQTSTAQTSAADTMTPQEPLSEGAQEITQEEANSDDDQKADSSFHSAKESLSDSEKQEVSEVKKPSVVILADPSSKEVVEKTDKPSAEKPGEPIASTKPQPEERAAPASSSVGKKPGAKQTESLNPFAAQKALARKEKMAAKKAKKKSKPEKKPESVTKAESKTKPKVEQVPEGSSKAKGEGEAKDSKEAENEVALPEPSDDGRTTSAMEPRLDAALEARNDSVVAGMPKNQDAKEPEPSTEDKDAPTAPSEEAPLLSPVLKTLTQEAIKPVSSSDITTALLDIVQEAPAPVSDIADTSSTVQVSKKAKVDIKVAVPQANLLARKSSSNHTGSNSSSRTDMMVKDTKGKGKDIASDISGAAEIDSDLKSDASSEKTAVPEVNFYTPLQTPSAFEHPRSPTPVDHPAVSANPTTESKPELEVKKKKKNKSKKKKNVTVNTPADDTRPDVGSKVQSDTAAPTSRATSTADHGPSQSANTHTFSDQLAHIDVLNGRRQPGMSYYEGRNSMQSNERPKQVWENMSITQQMEDYAKERALTYPLRQQAFQNPEPTLPVERPPLDFNAIAEIIERKKNGSWISKRLEEGEEADPKPRKPFFHEPEDD